MYENLQNGLGSLDKDPKSYLQTLSGIILLISENCFTDPASFFFRFATSFLIFAEAFFGVFLRSFNV